MMCRIYEVRPLICHEFEMGEPDCIDEREKGLSSQVEPASTVLDPSRKLAPIGCAMFYCS